MKTAMARIAMSLAAGCLGERRREWSMAMQAEFETALAEGEALQFAIGCLMAAWREMLTDEEGRLLLTSYALVLCLIIPMAALQVGCALFGLPYLYPGQEGLPGALLEGGAHENLLRGIYQAAILPLTLLQILIGLGHLRIAWMMLEHDWAGVTRSGISTLAASVTLILFMSILFIDGSQALLQGAVLAIELAAVAILARWHAQLSPGAGTRQPG